MRPRLHLAQQQATPIGADPPPIRPPYHPPSSKTVKFHPLCITLCFHKAVLVIAHNMLIAHILCHEIRPFSWLSVAIRGRHPQALLVARLRAGEKLSRRSSNQVFPVQTLSSLGVGILVSPIQPPPSSRAVCLATSLSPPSVGRYPLNGGAGDLFGGPSRTWTAGWPFIPRTTHYYEDPRLRNSSRHALLNSRKGSIASLAKVSGISRNVLFGARRFCQLERRSSIILA